MIAETTIQAVKDAPIVEIVSHYVNLKRKGVNYLGNCPFHNERTPSFIVNPVRNKYKCFGCGVSGDAIGFVMEYEKRSFAEAIELIAGISNIPLIKQERTQRTQRTQQATVKRKPVKSPIVYDTIPVELILANGGDLLSNPLIKSLSEVFTSDILIRTINEYSIKVSSNWITYPQIDFKGQYRTAKAIRYNDSCHREGLPIWLHSTLKEKGLLSQEFKLKQCFTGEHLLPKFPGAKVGIVEGQSTLLFMAALSFAAREYNIKALEYFSQFVWLCTGGSDGIGWKGEGVTDCLKYRSVILFPDAGFYDQWLLDAEEIREAGINVAVSDLIENKYQAGIVKYNEDLRDFFSLHIADISKEVAGRTIYNINIEDVEKYQGADIYGKDFDNVIIENYVMKDGPVYRVPFTKDGEFITDPKQITGLIKFFEQVFIPATFSGDKCLLNITNN